VPSASINIDGETSTTRDITINTVGEHTVEVEPISVHYPSVVVRTDVTVRGEGHSTTLVQ